MIVLMIVLCLALVVVVVGVALVAGTLCGHLRKSGQGERYNKVMTI